MPVPKQKPRRSRQDFSTPEEFIAAVKSLLHIDQFLWDLAAEVSNAKADRWYGPGSPWGQNSLGSTSWRVRDSWHWATEASWAWLNPPFGGIAPFAMKCALHSEVQHIAFLVPASVGSEWFTAWVKPYATVLLLKPRISFDGVGPYPKDCILALYGPGIFPSCHTWDWRAQCQPKST